MVGLLMLVSSLVDSVTSTSFLVSFGDMRTVSGPMLAASSGALAGQISTMIGLSAPIAGKTRHSQKSRETITSRCFMVAPLFTSATPLLVLHQAGRSSALSHLGDSPTILTNRPARD